MEKRSFLEVCFPRLCSLANVSKWNEALMGVNVSRFAGKYKIRPSCHSPMNSREIFRGGYFVRPTSFASFSFFLFSFSTAIYLRYLFVQFRSRYTTPAPHRVRTYLFNYSLHIAHRLCVADTRSTRQKG